MFLTKLKKYWLGILVLVFLTIGAFGVVYLVKKPIPKTKISAAAGSATVRIQPESIILPQQKVLQIWVTVDKPIGFIDLDISFDNSKLSLTKEPNLSVSSTNIVSLTNMADANTSGRITFVAGVDPTKISTAPNGTFQVGSVEFINKPAFTSGSTTIGIQTNESQLVDMDATPFTVSGVNATVTVAGSSTVTPTPTATSSSGKVRGDVNGDRLVNMVDIGLVVDKYGNNNSDRTNVDLNKDNKVDIIDIGIIVDNYE